MNHERLQSFLHLIKRSGVIKLGSDYLTQSHLPRISMVLISDEISDLSRENVVNFTTRHHLLCYDVPANIIVSLYPGKHVKVLVITSRESAKKIANLMKEGDPYE